MPDWIKMREDYIGLSGTPEYLHFARTKGEAESSCKILNEKTDLTRVDCIIRWKRYCISGVLQYS